MNRPHLLALLNLPPDSAIYLTYVTHHLWGQDLIFACSAADTLFEMHFSDCRDIHWQLYTHMQLRPDEDPAFPTTELVNVRVGRFQHRSPCKFLTAHFGLTLVYDKLHIINSDIHLPFDRPSDDTPNATS